MVSLKKKYCPPPPVKMGFVGIFRFLRFFSIFFWAMKGGNNGTRERWNKGTIGIGPTGEGGLCPGKLTLGKIVSEIYFGPVFFTRVLSLRPEFFQLFFLRKAQYYLVIKKYKPKISSALSVECPFYASKPRRDRIFTPHF